MKQKILYWSVIIILMICASCNMLPDVQDEEPEYITLSLGVSDESGSKITKSASTVDIYGINVYYDSKKDGNIDAHYAYGLFDNTEDMTIQLLKGYHYQFACTLVKNGKNTLYYGQYGSNNFSGYAKPFQRSNSESTSISNRFIYKNEDDDYLSGIGSGAATVKSASGYEEKTMPSIERYYGEVTDYVPVTGGIVTIPLKKTVFGLRLIIERVPEGTLTASCAGGLISGNATSSSSYDSGALLFSFPNVYACWKNAESYSVDCDVSWSFNSLVFDQWNQSDARTVKLKRNVLSTVTVTCSPDNASGVLSLNEDEYFQNGIYLFVNSDGVIEIGIQPDPED